MDKCQNCQLELQFQCDHEDCLRSEISEIVNPTGILTIIQVDAHTMSGDLFRCLNEIDKQNDTRRQQVWIDYFNSCDPTVDFYHRHDIWRTCLKSNYMRSMKLCSMATKQKSEIEMIIQSLLDWVYKETPGYNLIRLLNAKSNIKNLKKLTDELIVNGLTSINIDTNSMLLNKEKFLKRYPTRDLAEIELELTTKATCNQSDALDRILHNLNLTKTAQEEQMYKIRLIPINDHNRQLLMIRVKDIIRLEQNAMPSKNEFPTRIIYKVGGKERVALVSTTIDDVIQCVANTKEI